MSDPAHQLVEALIFELARAMALPQTKRVRILVRLIFGRATRRFSEMVLALDRIVGQNGPSAGAQWLLPHFVAGY